MDNGVSNRMSREDWIHGALKLLSTNGVKGVKIVPPFRTAWRDQWQLLLALQESQRPV